MGSVRLLLGLSEVAPDLFHTGVWMRAREHKDYVTMSVRRGAAGRRLGHVELVKRNQDLWSLEKFLSHTEGHHFDRYEFLCINCTVYIVWSIDQGWREWPYFGRVSFNLQKVG